MAHLIKTHGQQNVSSQVLGQLEKTLGEYKAKSKIQDKTLSQQKK